MRELSAPNRINMGQQHSKTHQVAYGQNVFGPTELWLVPRTIVTVLCLYVFISHCQPVKTKRASYAAAGLLCNRIFLRIKRCSAMQVAFCCVQHGAHRTIPMPACCSKGNKNRPTLPILVSSSLTQKITSFTSSTRTRRGGSCLRDIYKTFLIYRTCMRRAPAKPVRACTLRNWCSVSHVAFEAPRHTSHPTLHTSHCTLPTSHSTLHASQSTLHA